MSSLDLEDLILQHPVLIEAAVIGVPDPKWTERPLALVVVQSGQQVSEAEIKAHIHDFAARSVISRYGIPARIAFVEVLPKTSVGKLDKKALRQLYPG